jgi:membrane-associated phospholipid phosphatase
MKTKLLLLTFITGTFALFSQNDSIKKSNIFQTSGRVIKNSILTIPSDFGFMGKQISNDWKKTGIYTAGILGLIATDKITTGFWQEQVEPNIQYKLPNFSPVNSTSIHKWMRGENAYLTFPTIGIYLGSFLANNERGQYATINTLKAIQYATIITQLGLKTVFGRNRPNRPLSKPAKYPWTNNNWDFFNKRKEFLFASAEGSALPSLHSTTYFAIAKVYQMEFNNYWIPYGVIAAVWLSDIESHNHWVSDIIAAGIIGTIIGKSIVLSSWKKRGINGYKKKNKNISFQVIPQFSSEFSGLHIVGNF